MGQDEVNRIMYVFNVNKLVTSASQIKRTKNTIPRPSAGYHLNYTLQKELNFAIGNPFYMVAVEYTAPGKSQIGTSHRLAICLV